MAADPLEDIDLAALPPQRVPPGPRQRVHWPYSDQLAPDYRHLAVALDANPFLVTAGTLAALADANGVDLSMGRDRVIIGLRGCTVPPTVGAVTADFPSGFQDSVRMVETTPNHNTFQCTIVVWTRTGGQIAAFRASTVPNWVCMQACGAAPQCCNLLPTGFYEYAVGTHRPNKVGQQLGALIEQDIILVLRLENALAESYTVHGNWTVGDVGDDIHAGRREAALDGGPSFSSAGCQTIPGDYDPDSGVPNGLWASFRTALELDNGRLSAQDGARFPYLLLTGRDARLASAGAVARRLRFGSSGAAVSLLQAGLIAQHQRVPSPTGRYDAATALAVTNWQRAVGLAPDGIISPSNGPLLGVVVPTVA
jgi:hypothetical protein